MSNPFKPIIIILAPPQDNQISSICALHALPSCQILDLSFNSLADLECLQCLAPLSALRTLALNDNPISAPQRQPQRQQLESQAYLQAVARAAPWVTELDGEPAHPHEAARRAAARVAGSHLAALATLRALTSGAWTYLPAAESVEEVPQQSAGSMEEISHQARLISALASSSQGDDLPAAGVPVTLLCTRDNGGRSWLEAAELSYAASGPSVVAAEQAQDGAAAARQLSQCRQGGVPDEAEYGRLLDRQPLHGLAKAAGKWAALREVQFGGLTPGAGAAESGRPLAAEQQREMEAAVRLMQEQHAEGALQPACAFTQQGRCLPPDQEDGELCERPSYYAGLVEETGFAAVCMQAVWRARRARQDAGRLRSDQHRGRVAAAALLIQAAWRGHAVRGGEDLATRRLAMRARREGAEAVEQTRRAAAAVRIQAAARGLGVRRRLKAAVQASRYVDTNDGGAGADDDDFDFDQDADALLSGLKGVEDFLRAEEPSFMAAATAAMATQQLQDRKPAPQSLPDLRPPSLSVPGEHDQDPLHHPSPGPHVASLSAPSSVQAWVEAVVPASPTSTIAGGAQRPQDPHWGSSSQAPESQCSPTEGGRGGSQSLALKQQRYREKLEALMADWGFQDLATAEAYYRRQKRQNQGQAQQKAEERYKDPAQRLRRLHEAVDGRPQLRAEDVQRHAVKGPEVALHRGALQGPPSREAPPPAFGGTGRAVQQGRGGAPSPVRQVGRREVSSAEPAMQSSPSSGRPLVALHPGASPARSSSFELRSSHVQQPRHPSSLLPPLSQQQQQQSLRYTASLNGDTDAQSTCSAAQSDGMLVGQRRRAHAAAGVSPPTRSSKGMPPVAGRLVLPAMPGAPSVNRWVLSEPPSGGDAGAGVSASPHWGTLEVNASKAVVKKKVLAPMP